jgi:hypothetical protein
MPVAGGLLHPSSSSSSGCLPAVTQAETISRTFSRSFSLLISPDATHHEEAHSSEEQARTERQQCVQNLIAIGVSGAVLLGCALTSNSASPTSLEERYSGALLRVALAAVIDTEDGGDVDVEEGRLLLKHADALYDASDMDALYDCLVSAYNINKHDSEGGFSLSSEFDALRASRGSFSLACYAYTHSCESVSSVMPCCAVAFVFA